MSSSYGDGGFFFLKPVGAGPGYPGSTSGYGELAFDGQVYTDGKEYPVQAPLRLGYGDADYGRAAKWNLRPGVQTREIRFKYDDEEPADAAVRVVYDYEKMVPNQNSIALVNEQIAYYKDYAEARRTECRTFDGKATGIPFTGYRDACRKYRVTLKVLEHYYKALNFLNRKIAEGGARPQASAPQILRYAPPVVRQGFRPTPQTIPSDIRGALARLMARRAQARTQAELRALQAEIARLQQMLMMQAAAAQQTAPAITQMPPVGMATAPAMDIPAPAMVPEGAVQAMPDAEEVKEKQVVGLDAAAGASTEEPTFLEKYGLFLGLGALAVGGYWYMNRGQKAEKKV